MSSVNKDIHSVPRSSQPIGSLPQATPTPFGSMQGRAVERMAIGAPQMPIPTPAPVQMPAPLAFAPAAPARALAHLPAAGSLPREHLLFAMQEQFFSWLAGQRFTDRISNEIRSEFIEQFAGIKTFNKQAEIVRDELDLTIGFLVATIQPESQNEAMPIIGKIDELFAEAHQVHQNAIRVRVKEKIGRVKKVLKRMVQGTGQLKAQNRPSRIVDSYYVVAELIKTDPAIPRELVQTLQMLWKASDTQLHYGAWIESLLQEWKDARTNQPFFNWFASRQWDEKERAVWANRHPGEPFLEQNFRQWQQSQYSPDSLLADPKWMLIDQWMQYNQNRPIVSFEQWLKHIAAERKQKLFAAQRANYGIPSFIELNDATLKKIDKLIFEYEKAHSHQLSQRVLAIFVWVERELWKQMRPADQSDAAFIDHIERLQCGFIYSAQILQQINGWKLQLDALQSVVRPTYPRTHSEQIQERRTKIVELEGALKHIPESYFHEWKRGKEQSYLSRWAVTRTSLPFGEWKAQQVINPFIVQPFVTLNIEQQKGYLAQCSRGYLMRGKMPFATTLESTAHAGKGWMIFVIGPQKGTVKSSFYCASHIKDVFHHSSFLGNSAVMAAGEIKTNARGKITHISNKSGHYKPTEQENVAMLRWFESQGVNLAEITFTYFLPDWKMSPPTNAKTYVDSVRA